MLSHLFGSAATNNPKRMNKYTVSWSDARNSGVNKGVLEESESDAIAKTKRMVVVIPEPIYTAIVESE